MPHILFGTGSTAVTCGASPGEHNLQDWGNHDSMQFPLVASVGAGVANTTVQGTWVNPYSYIYLWDVVASVSASGTGGTHSVDIFNAFSGGATRLVTPINITTGLAALTTFSGRFQASPILAPMSDPELASAGQGTLATWRSTYVFTRGTVFSLRCVTPAATGSLTNLFVSMIFFASDRPWDNG